MGTSKATRVHPWENAWRSRRWREVTSPLPAVEEFCGYLQERRMKRILDLGAGGGRHTLLLGGRGLQVVALDVSDTALKILDRRLREARLYNVTLVEHGMARLPFVDGYFDGIVCTNVMHHGRTREVKAAFKEAMRVLRRGGAGLFVVVSDKDFRFGTGRKLEPGTFVFTSGEEKGIVHHFFGSEEFIRLLRGHKVTKFCEELLPDGGKNRAHFYAVVVRR